VHKKIESIFHQCNSYIDNNWSKQNHKHYNIWPQCINEKKYQITNHQWEVDDGDSWTWMTTTCNGNKKTVDNSGDTKFANLDDNIDGFRFKEDEESKQRWKEEEMRRRRWNREKKGVVDEGAIIEELQSSKKKTKWSHCDIFPKLSPR